MRLLAPIEREPALDPEINMNTSSPAEKLPPCRVNVYEVRPANTGEGFDLISDALATGRLRLSKEHVAVGYATLHRGANAALIRVYDAAGEVIATHQQPPGRGTP